MVRSGRFGLRIKSVTVCIAAVVGFADLFCRDRLRDEAAEESTSKRSL